MTDKHIIKKVLVDIPFWVIRKTAMETMQVNKMMDKGIII